MKGYLSEVFVLIIKLNLLLSFTISDPIQLKSERLFKITE